MERKPISIRRKLFWCMVMLVLAMTVLVDGIVYYVYKEDIERKVVGYADGMIQEMAKNLSGSVRSLEENMMYKITASGLFDYLEAPEENQSYSARSGMQSFAALMNSAVFEIDEVYIVDINHNTFFYDKKGQFQNDKEQYEQSLAGQYIVEKYDELMSRRGTTSWMQFEDQPGKIFLIKSVLDQDTLGPEGILCLSIEDFYLKSFDEDVSMQTAVYNEDGQLICADDGLSQVAGQQPQEEKLESDEGNYLILKAQVSRKRWILNGFISERSVLQSHRQLMKNLFLIEIGFLILCAVLASAISKGMTSNIRALIENFRRINRGEEAVPIQCRSRDETAYLCERFNDMNLQLKDSIDQIVISSTQKEKAEYNALLAQMNPHFLYNTLESISAMARIHGEREVVEAVGKLAGLLRASLSGEKQEIQVKQELQYVRQYLDLEKLISGEQLEWDIISSEELDELSVPKLILQPIIENSILHGFDGMEDVCMIIIVVRQEKDKLLLEVSDNGKGIRQELADQILREEETEELARDRAHIGICSIQKRIHMLYGNEYGMKIESAEGKGMIVRIFLPLIKEKIQ